MMQYPNKREDLTKLCLAQLATIVPDLDMTSISTADSLTEDLLLDSFLLASFVDRLDQEFADIDMTRWFMTASRGGQDTIDALVSFLLESPTG